MKNILILLLAMTLAGCGARKKEVQKTSSESDLAVTIDTAKHVVENVSSNETSKTTIGSEFAKEFADIEVGEGGTAVIRDFDSKGNVARETTIHGKGKASSGKEKANTQAANVTGKTIEAQSDMQASGKINAKAKNKTRSKEVDLKRDSFCFAWLWWLLLIPAGIYVYYRIRKRAK